MNVDFRLAKVNDLKNICLLYKSAIDYMKSQGIEQWDDLYPAADVLLGDINNSEMYVLTQGNTVLSAIILNDRQDAEYDKGKWRHEPGKIAVVHRLCVNPDFQNQGVGRMTMTFAEKNLTQAGFTAVRLDAFSKNPHVLNLYEKSGYTRAGEVYFRKGRFILFEKPL